MSRSLSATRLSAAMAIAIGISTVATTTAAHADRPASLVGHYYLGGVRETGSELLLTADGQFQWYLTYGAVDLFAEGTWDRQGNVVTLTAQKDEKAPPPGFDTLALTDREGKLIPPDGRGAYERGSDMPAPPEQVLPPEKPAPKN